MAPAAPWAKARSRAASRSVMHSRESATRPACQRLVGGPDDGTATKEGSGHAGVEALERDGLDQGRQLDHAGRERAQDEVAEVPVGQRLAKGGCRQDREGGGRRRHGAGVQGRGAGKQAGGRGQAQLAWPHAVQLELAPLAAPRLTRTSPASSSGKPWQGSFSRNNTVPGATDTMDCLSSHGPTTESAG
jgi:hypothetical protein